jgi:hypothetical protein
MFIVIGRMPDQPHAVARAAQVAGLAVPDAARLLAGTLPRILVRATSEAEALVASLNAEGFLAWAEDPSQIQGDEARVLVRSLAWESEGIRVVDGKGESHDCPKSAVRLLQRGARNHVATQVVKTKETRFDVGMAVMSGGMMLTKTVEHSKELTTQAKEPFVLLQRGDGRPDLMIYERRMNYHCLGEEMTQATLTNFGRLVSRLQAFFDQAPMDDRVARPGFVAGLPLLGVEALDLGLSLVSQARHQGC